MSNTLVYSGVSKKTLAIIAITIGVLFVALIGIRYAAAVAPSDYGLKEGDTVSAAGSDDPDVYIVNEQGYKRLFLNPVIFGFYGHLGGFANVKSVTPATRDAFPTSGLFRNCETNDLKVYGVETTGEDTGVLHWVNTSGAQAVADDANFFKKVFCINTNEENWYGTKGTDYTSVSQVPSYARVPGVTPGVTGAITASLASDNPAAGTLTTKANGVTYLKVNLAGTGTVSSLKITRRSAGATTDFANIYVYEGAKRLTSGRTLSASDGTTTFASLNIAVSGSKVLSIVADMKATGATVGDVNSLSINSASDITLSSGTVGGSFPLNGNNFTVSGAVGGVITITNSGSIGSPNVGQSHIQIAEFKLAAATEAAKVSRVQLIQGGTVKMADISNLTLEVLGTKVADGTTLSTGYIVFDMISSPYTIAKGDNRIFKVYADVQGKKAETLIFYLEVTSDLLAIGDQYGFGMSVTNTYQAANAQTLTLQGGVLTLSFVGPTATNISTTTSKTHLLDFDINAAANVELRQHVIILCKDDLGTGTYANAADSTNGWADIESVGIIDRDTGVTLVGTADGSSFTNTTYDDVDDGCPNAASGAPYKFTDTVSFSAGETKHLAIVGDIKTANTNAGTIGDIVSTDVIKAVLYGYGTQAGTSGDLTISKYSNTNVALTSSDIVPSGNISGNNMTVQGSSLTLALAANPATGNHNFVKNTKNVTANGFSLTTALGNSVTLTAVTVTGYVSDSGTGTAGARQAKGAAASTNADSGLSVSSLVSAIRLVDGDTGAVLATAPTTNNLMNTTGTAAFSNLSWVIPGGTTKTLLVQVDLANYTSGTTDTFAFDIAASTDVTAVDQNSNTINLAAANEAVNGPPTTAATTYTTTNSKGTLTFAAAADSPAKAPIYWGQTDAAFSKFKLTSTNEGFFIERLYLYTGDTRADLTNNVDRVKISYTNQAGSTLTATATPNSTATISFSFDGSLRPYVPKDGSAYITVSANLKTAATLFRATGKNFSIDLAGTSADDLRAVGEGSSAVITGTTTGSGGASEATTAGQNMYVYRSYPQFTYVSTPGTTIAVGQDVLKFKVDAMGLYSDGATVFFDGATANASGSLKFAVYASGSSPGTASASLGFDLRRVVDADGLTVDQLVASRTVVGNGSGPCLLTTNCEKDFGVPNKGASVSFRFNDLSGTTNSVEIPAGKSNTFVVRINAAIGFTKGANATTGRSADYVQLILRNSEGSLVTWTDNGGTNRNGDEASTANILKNLPVTGTQINHP